MGRYNLTDLMLTDNGDLSVSNGDLVVISDNDFIAQGTVNRVKSVTRDWFYDRIGADMEELLGKSNTAETGQLGVTKITSALTKDGFINKEDIYVRPVPISKDEIIFYIFINTPNTDDPIGFEILLDLASGIKVREV